MQAAWLLLLLAPAVDVEVFETGVPTAGWPKAWPEATERYTEPAFALSHLPWRYTGTGVRAQRPNPLLMRAAVTSTLPAGRYRVLLRARGAARLLLDGKEVVTLAGLKALLNGHNPIRRDALDLGMTRRLGVGDHEKLADVVLDGKPHRWELHLRVGAQSGKTKMRQELGETLVALAPSGTDDFFLLGERVPLTDDGWDAYAARAAKAHEDREASLRRQAFLAHADELHERRRQDRLWLAAHSPPAVPAPSKGLPAFNEVDHFLNVRIAEAQAARPDADRLDFHRDVRPVLAKHCLSCHDKKPRGGLKLTSRKEALAGGDSGPAVVPGRPDKSEMVKRLNHADPERRMPPAGREMPDADRRVLEKWIAQGADWPDAPRVTLTALPDSVDPLAFLRRAHLDLVGTAPTLEEIGAFDGNRRAVLDRLLDDPR